MKQLAALLILFAVVPLAFPQQKSADQSGDHGQADKSSLVYAKGGGFMIDAPEGWIVDREVGKQLGACCVYYPRGSTWDNAETVMYPNIVTKGPEQQTLKEFMESDLANFREHSPAMTFEDSKDVPLTHNRVAKVRLFYNVNKGSSEAVAYIDEEKVIALIVVSSKSKKALKESMPRLQTTLQTYTYTDVKVEEGAKPEK